jgi:hypothetical protein
LTAEDRQGIFDALLGRDAYAPHEPPRVGVPVHTTHGQAIASLGVYLVEQEPPFLQGSRVRERRGAFLLVVEFREHAAVFSRNVGDVAMVLPDQFNEISQGAATRLLADGDTRYERVRMTNMTIARSVIRARTVEAVDLRGILNAVTSRRSVPTGMRYVSRAGRFSVTPGVARLQEHRPRASLEDLAAWAATVIADVPGATARSIPFLESFPRPITLAMKPDSVKPAGLLLQLEELFDGLEDGRFIVLAGTPVAKATRADEHHIRNRLLPYQEVLELDDDGNVRGAPAPESVRAHKLQYGFHCRTLEDVVVEEVESGLRKTLPGWLSSNQHFIVTFSDPEYAYVGGTLFRDAGLMGTIETVISTLEVDWPVAGATSEKGTTRSKARFSPKSLFGVTEKRMRDAGKTLVICDDLGDEWADFIAVDDRAGRREIQLAHCKHGDGNTSASALHVVVAQAMKNLGRLVPSDADLRRKARTWRGRCHGLPRVRHGAAGTSIVRAFRAVNGDPASRREVIIVVDYLSRNALQKAARGVKRGDSVRPHLVQLFWLLASFVLACVEVGATPRIKCRH